MTMIYLTGLNYFFSKSQGKKLFQIIRFNILFWPCKLFSRIYLENKDSLFCIGYVFYAKKFNGLPFVEFHLPTTFFLSTRFKFKTVLYFFLTQFKPYLTNVMWVLYCMIMPTFEIRHDYAYINFILSHSIQNFV